MQTLRKIGENIREVALNAVGTTNVHANKKPIIEGQLTKLATKSHSKWDQRYFVLYNDSLAYYVDSTSEFPKGELKLNPDYFVSDSMLRPHCFQVSDLNDVYYIAADSDEEKLFWMHTIARVIRNMSQIVTDLPLHYVELDKKVEQYAVTRPPSIRASYPVTPAPPPPPAPASAPAPAAARAPPPPPPSASTLNPSAQPWRAKDTPPPGAAAAQPAAPKSAHPAPTPAAPAPAPAPAAWNKPKPAVGGAPAASWIKPKPVEEPHTSGHPRQEEPRHAHAPAAARAGTDTAAAAAAAPAWGKPKPVAGSTGGHKNSAVALLQKRNQMAAQAPSAEPAAQPKPQPTATTATPATVTAAAAPRAQQPAPPAPKPAAVAEPTPSEPTRPLSYAAAAQSNKPAPPVAPKQPPAPPAAAPTKAKQPAPPPAAHKPPPPPAPKAVEKAPAPSVGSEADTAQVKERRPSYAAMVNAPAPPAPEPTPAAPRPATVRMSARDMALEAARQDEPAAAHASQKRSSHNREKSAPPAESRPEPETVALAEGGAQRRLSYSQAVKEAAPKPATLPKAVPAPAPAAVTHAAAAVPAGGGVAGRKAMWQQKADAHAEVQKTNVFREGGVQAAQGAALKPGDPGYGHAAEGSLTAERAAKAADWVTQEINKLISVIQKIGSVNAQGQTFVCFGPLFYTYTDISDTLVGIMMRAKKRKLISYPGDMLFQGVHDDVEVIIL